MKYIANPVVVDAFKIISVLPQDACLSDEGGAGVCGRPQSEHTPEAAKGDVGMDHDFMGSKALDLVLEDGQRVVATPAMISRMAPSINDYWVVQADGYTYLNPKDVFERKYSLDPNEAARVHRVPLASDNAPKDPSV